MGENYMPPHQERNGIVRLRQALRDQMRQEGEGAKLDLIVATLNAYADQRGTSRPLSVISWTSGHHGDDCRPDIIIAFDLRNDAPRGIWEQASYHFREEWFETSGPMINRAISGHDNMFVEDCAIAWGKGIIDRVADCNFLLPPSMHERVADWLTDNCVGEFHWSELDPKHNPFHPFFSGDNVWPYYHVLCLSFDEFADAVLFRLRWL